MPEKNIAKAANFLIIKMLQKILCRQINISKSLFIRVKSKLPKSMGAIDYGKKILLFIGAKKKMIKIIQIILIIKNFISKEKNLFIIIYLRSRFQIFVERNVELSHRFFRFYHKTAEKSNISPAARKSTLQQRIFVIK